MTVRSPGTVVLEGIMFYNRCFIFYLFILPQHLRGPLADLHETLPRDHYLGALCNASPKIWGCPPQKLGRFCTTSNFDREYLWNETRYPKSERYVIENDSSHVRQKKSGNYGPLSRK